MNERHFLIPYSLLSGVVEYLKKRPYDEVALVISSLMQVKEAKISEKSKQSMGEGVEGDFSGEG